jgi:hypothetical protein
MATPYVVTCYKTTRRITEELSLKGILCSQRAHDLHYPAIFLAFFEPLKIYPRMPSHDQRRPYVRYCNYVQYCLLQFSDLQLESEKRMP